MKIPKIIIPKTAKIIICIILILGVASSGWLYYYLKTRNDKDLAESIALNNSFVQQYGQDAKVLQLVIPDKVYAVSWEDGDKTTHVSWNIGGLWVEVWNNKKNIITSNSTP